MVCAKVLHKFNFSTSVGFFSPSSSTFSGSEKSCCSSSFYKSENGRFCISGVKVEVVGVATEAILPKDFFCFRKLRAKEFVNDNMLSVCSVRMVFF